MKADRKESRYTVELKPKDGSWKRDLWLGAVILIAVLFVASLINNPDDLYGNGINAVILLCGIILLVQMHEPQKPGTKICVSEDSFTVIREGMADREYRFSEITRVSFLRPQYISGRRVVRSGPVCWQIFIGDQCAAVFTQEMENYFRLLGKLDELGMITPYGTGIRGQDI